MHPITHVWPEPHYQVNGFTEASATIESPMGARRKLWFRIPDNFSDALSPSADAFILASVFLAMRHRTQLYVHAPISPRLLANLEYFQSVWSAWRPSKFTPIDLKCESEQTQPKCSSRKSVVAFSGGVDAAFSVYRHCLGPATRRTHAIGGAVFVHGFDIPLNDRDGYMRAFARANAILSDLSIPLIPLETNWRDLDTDWEDSHASALAACLHILSGRFDAGIIASSEPICAFIPWGSNPLTDPLLSSDSFEIVHDGAEKTRSEKIAELSQWPQGVANLRVCWEGLDRSLNCGSCEKCVRTILNFRVVGMECPSCFEKDVSLSDIANLVLRSNAQFNEFRSLLSVAEGRGLGDQGWVEAVRKCLARNAPSHGLAQKVLRRLRRAATFSWLNRSSTITQSCKS